MTNLLWPIRDYTLSFRWLHYRAREIFAIIVTPGSLLGNVGLHCYYGASWRSITLWKHSDNVYIARGLNLLVVFGFKTASALKPRLSSWNSWPTSFQTSNMYFYLMELSESLLGYGIVGPGTLFFFTTSKWSPILGLAAGSFRLASAILGYLLANS